MDQTSCLKISCNASKTLPRPRPASISRAAASSCLSWSWKTRMHITGPKLIITPEQTGQLTESQTEMALLLQGKSWTDTGEHRFALEAGPLRLRRAFCGVEREGESFLLRVNALSRNNALPADAKAELEASVRTPSAAAGRWGWTSPDSVRIRHCVTVTLRSQQKTSARKFGQT